MSHHQQVHALVPALDGGFESTSILETHHAVGVLHQDIQTAVFVDSPIHHGLGYVFP